MNNNFNNFCCYCGKILLFTAFDFSMEHLVPKSKGGNNLLINKKPCCKNCNNWRNNQTLKQFKRNVKFHLDNKILIKKYTLYDYEIMLENIDYWQNFLESDIKKFKKRTR